MTVHTGAPTVGTMGSLTVIVLSLIRIIQAKLLSPFKLKRDSRLFVTKTCSHLDSWRLTFSWNHTSELFPPHRKHTCLLLFREKIAVYFEKDTEHINTLCGNMISSLKLEYVVPTVTTRPRGLRRGSVVVRVLGFWVRIPPEACMSLSCKFCVLSGRGLCVGLITCPEESCCVWCAWVWSRSVNNEEALAH
jgi:hypothetical protein